MMKIAIFASGNGSNFQSIVDAYQEEKLHAEVRLLVCDKPNAFVIERARKANIESFVFSPKAYGSKADFEQEIVDKLIDLGIDFIVLAGYMRLIGPTLLNAFEGKIVNIHPSLLPSFPGKDAIGQAMSAGVKVTGVTVHYVDEGMDTGPIIAQQAIDIKDDETKESLEQRIHEVEHILYPKTLNKLFTSKIMTK